MFLVLWQVIFLLYSGHFEYYVMRLWILFKPPVLTDLLWWHVNREKGALPCYLEVGVGVQFPHSTFIYSLGWEVCLITADGVEVHAPFKLLWTPAWLVGSGALCYFHVASTDREVRRLSLPLGYDERPCCPLGLLWHHPAGGKGVPCYSQLSLEIQASFSDFDDESGVRATAFFSPLWCLAVV